MSGDLRETSPIVMPYTLGHENVGYVHELGSEVIGFKTGDLVMVYGGWGCGTCEHCRGGDEQICPDRQWAGVSPRFQGGYAEYMYVPSYKYLIKVEGDPAKLAPLTDAGLSSYRPVKKAMKFLGPDSFSAVIGVGGLGSFAVQYLKLLTNSSIIAVDISEERLGLAKDLGADFAVNSQSDRALEKLKGIVAPSRGAMAILDFVGLESTAEMALKIIAKKGVYIDMGLAGGITRIHLPFLTRTEITVTGSGWGNYNELSEVYRLYHAGKIRVFSRTRKLEEINSVADEMKRGALLERIVLVP